MKYLKLFEGFKDIEFICKEYGIKNYTINSDGSIDVDDDVDLSNDKLDILPLKFNKVSGYFDCANNQLTSLVGAPIRVGRHFYCDHNKLTSLEGAPKEVGRYFDCSDNQLTNLMGDFKCDHILCRGNNLPIQIYNNYIHIQKILKLQNDYSIWNKDGSFNEFRFDDMMEEIKE